MPGATSWPRSSRAHADCLKPGGLGMLHFIGHVGRCDTELFIRKHVFPGGWIPSLADAMVEMERCGLEVVDIENLRRHYALTLDAWAERFERRWPDIQALDPQRFDERFRRIWRSYLVGCAEMFRSPAGYTHLFQIVFSKGNLTRDSYPMSRAHLYEHAVTAAAEPADHARRVQALRDAAARTLARRRGAARPGQDQLEPVSRPPQGAKRRLDLSDFCHVLQVDADEGWVDVEGLTSYEALVTRPCRTASCRRWCRSSRPSPWAARWPVSASRPPRSGRAWCTTRCSSSTCCCPTARS